MRSRTGSELELLMNFRILTALAVAVCLGQVCAEDKPATTRQAVMCGGTAEGNMVNTVEKNVPASWSIKKGEEKNIKWVATLGKVSYGGPVVAGGKIFVGTNNVRPRDPKVKG